MTTVSMTTLLLTSFSILTSTEAQPGKVSILSPLTNSPSWRTPTHSSRGSASPPLSQNSLMTQRLATARRERTAQTRRSPTSSWEATPLSTHGLFSKSTSQAVTTLLTSVQQSGSINTLKLISSTSLPAVKRVTVRFLSLHEDHLLTTAGAMTTRGNVTIEHVTSKPGGYLEPVVMVSSSSAVNLENTLPCVAEASPCTTGFNLRVTFELNKVGVDPAFIVWSGDDVSDMGNMTLYYHNNDFVLHFKSAGIIWNGTFNATLDPNTWHTVDASWDTRTPPKLFLDNQRLMGTVTHRPASSTSGSHPLYLGRMRSGPAENSTNLKVYALDLWTTSRSVINKTELRLQTIEDVVHVTPILPQKSVQGKTDCLSSDGFSNITHLNLTFLTANRSVVWTPSLPLPVHGSARLNVSTGVLTLRGPNSFVDINASCVPCLTDLRECHHGLSLQMDVLLSSLPLPPGARVHLFGGPNLASDESGIILKYEKDAFKAEVRQGRFLWLLNATTVLTNKRTCSLRLSWSPDDSLQLSVDGNLVQVGRQELSTLHAEKPSVLRMGSGSGGRYSNQTVEVSHVNIWTGSTAYLLEQGLWTVDTTTAGQATTSSLAAVIPSFRWIFSSASGPVLTSGGMRAEVKGDPESGPLGLDLVSSGQYVQVGNLHRNLTCLVVTDTCHTGVTVAVELMPRALSDGAVIFSSGADTNQAQGLALIYRFGQFHAMVSTKQRTMFVSFKRDLLPSDQVTEVHVAFQLPDVLRVYVMGEMVGPASSQAGTTSTEGLPSGGGALYVGRSSGVGPAGQPPGYTLTSVTVWLAGPDALEKVGLLRIVVSVASTSQTHSSVGSLAERTSSVDSATRPHHLTTLATPACRTDCGINRTCVAGTCVCDSLVAGNSCSPGHNYSRTGHTTTQLCDLRHENCDYVILQTSGYDTSQNVTCCALYVSHVSDAFQPTSPSVERVAALYSSGGHVLCPVRNHLSAWVWGEQPQGAASGDTVLHVVYDSICHICHLHADRVNITCTKRDSCLVDGQCFLRGQQQPDNDCNVCSPDLSTDNWTSTSGRDCMESDAQRNDDGDNRTTVVALGTVCGVLVFITTVAVVIYFLMRRKTNKQLLTIQETLAKMQTRSFATAFSSHSFISNGEFPRPDGLAKDEDMDLDHRVSDIDMLY